MSHRCGDHVWPASRESFDFAGLVGVANRDSALGMSCLDVRRRVTNERHAVSRYVDCYHRLIQKIRIRLEQRRVWTGTRGYQTQIGLEAM